MASFLILNYIYTWSDFLYRSRSQFNQYNLRLIEYKEKCMIIKYAYYWRCIRMYKKAHLISDFRKKVSPQLGLEPTNMRQNLKKSVSNMIECDVNVLSFGSDFSHCLKNPEIWLVLIIGRLLIRTYCVYIMNYGFKREQKLCAD